MNDESSSGSAPPKSNSTLDEPDLPRGDAERELDASPPGVMPPDPAPEPPNPFARMERLLAEIRAHLDASAREQHIREFSLARAVGALLQALVVGLVVWAASDWIFAADAQALLVKLAFAAVLELGVIAALLAAREGEP